MMTLKELKGVGGMLTSFLFMFGMCFENLAGRRLLRVYVQGQLSDLQRKNCEAIALELDVAPRTLQPVLYCFRGWNPSSGMSSNCETGFRKSS